MTMMGDMMGYDYEVEGDDEDDIEGARRRVVRARKRGLALPPKPGWRKGQVAPGVQAPGVGLVPLPLRPDANGGTYTAAFGTINWEARPQKPFRGERLLATVSVIAPAAGQVQCDGMFVGTDLQQAELGSFDLSFFSPTAFDVRMVFIQAEPGVLIRLQTHFQGVIGAGSAVVSLMLLGRYVH